MGLNFKYMVLSILLYSHLNKANLGINAEYQYRI